MRRSAGFARSSGPGGGTSPRKSSCSWTGSQRTKSRRKGAQSASSTNLIDRYPRPRSTSDRRWSSSARPENGRADRQPAVMQDSSAARVGCDCPPDHEPRRSAHSGSAPGPRRPFPPRFSCSTTASRSSTRKLIIQVCSGGPIMSESCGNGANTVTPSSWRHGSPPYLRGAVFTPSRSSYQIASASGSRARKKKPPIPVTRPTAPTLHRRS